MPSFFLVGSESHRIAALASTPIAGARQAAENRFAGLLSHPTLTANRALVVQRMESLLQMKERHRIERLWTTESPIGLILTTLLTFAGGTLLAIVL